MNFKLQSKREMSWMPKTYNPGPGYYVTPNIPKFSDIYKTSFPNNPNFDHLIRDANWSQQVKLKPLSK